MDTERKQRLLLIQCAKIIVMELVDFFGQGIVFYLSLAQWEVNFLGVKFDKFQITD